MKIALITPAARKTRNGNRNTAERWSRLLRELGHRVIVQTQWDGTPVDLMLALHARRSHASIARFAKAHPQAMLVVVLTGTDLYRDIQFDTDAQRSLQLAHRLVVLQDQGVKALPKAMRAKAHVVYQSATPIKRQASLQRSFEVLVVGHLRDEKDPLRTALALRYLPDDSRICVRQIGKGLDEALTHEARALMHADARYRWLGERAHIEVRKYLGRAKLMVISSRMEGGANVVSEALAAHCPVLASKVSGNVGMLGEDYVGYFPLADERALAALLHRAETDAVFYRTLRKQCDARAKLMTASAERAALARAIALAKTRR